MSNYYQGGGGGGGCFGESSTVIIVDTSGKQTKTRVNNVRKGDRVLVSGGELATVRCLV